MVGKTKAMVGSARRVGDDDGTVEITERFLEGNCTLPEGVDRVRFWDARQPGFGVVVGKRRVSFVVFARVKGERNKTNTTLGQWAPGKLRAASESVRASTITVAMARDAAIAALGQMRAGTNPNGEEQTPANGKTLREGLALHVKNMRKEGCSERSIGTIESEIPRLLDAWMDKPMTALTGADLVELHDKLTSEDKPYLANRIVAQVSAVWNALDRVYELDGRNPAKAVTRNPYTPSRERVDDLPDWWTKVQGMQNHVRRDLNVFCMFTGMRSEAARHGRWEHVNLTSKPVIIDETEVPPHAMLVVKPKGGEERAFTLPLGPRLVDMLKVRKKDNAAMFAPHGGDAGWIFPSLTRAAPYEVIPVAEAKEYRQTGGRKGPKEKFLPGLHTLRRTYLSVAAEAGIGELDRHVLANHSFGRQSVNETYIKQAFPHLAECQATVESALVARCTKQKQKSTKRRARAERA